MLKSSADIAEDIGAELDFEAIRAHLRDDALIEIIFGVIIDSR